MALSGSKNPKNLLLLEFIFYRIWVGRDLKHHQFHCHVCGNAFKVDSGNWSGWKRALRSSATSSALKCGVKELLERRGRAQGEGEKRRDVLGEVFGARWWCRRGHYSRGIIPDESQNPKTAWVGRDFQDSAILPHAMSRDPFHHPRGSWSTSRGWIPTAVGVAQADGCPSPPDCGRAARHGWRQEGGAVGSWGALNMSKGLLPWVRSKRG